MYKAYCNILWKYFLLNTGKLYKSKVCFIKHLWEHSVYWDLFPGDKNHERVLAIQAALILYSRYEGVKQEDAERSVFSSNFHSWLHLKRLIYCTSVVIKFLHYKLEFIMYDDCFIDFLPVLKQRWKMWRLWQNLSWDKYNVRIQILFKVDINYNYVHENKQ